MARFLLVHGSCHGAWCWRDVIPALGALGHHADAIDLPSHGANKTQVGDVTLTAYRDAILAACTADTIVVGHSMAGYPIAAAAEHAPDAMARLVFVCAYAPVSGLSLVQMRRAAPRQPLLGAIVMSQDRQSFTIDPDQVEQVFYHDCTPDVVAYAKAHLGPQAVLPQETPITLGARCASVPKSYIRCTQDQTIPPEYQITMTQGWADSDVYEMATGHSPFFADPSGLAEMLDRIAKGTS